MNTIFENMLIVSGLTSLFIVFFVIMGRTILKNTKMWWHSIIWLLILIRLLVPINPEIPYNIFRIDIMVEDIPADNIENIYSDTNTIAAEENANISTTNESPNIHSVNEVDLVTPTPYLGFSYYQSIWDVLMILYALGVMVSLAKLINSQIKLKRETNRLKTISNSDVINLVDSIRLKLNINRSVSLLLSDNVTSPSITGIYKPTIILSKDMLDNIEIKQLEYILLHELMYFKNKDTLKILFYEFVLCLHWFNPILHVCKRNFRQDIELICDEKVLDTISTDEHKSYGEILFSISTNESKKRLGLVSAYMAVRDKKNLKERLVKIKKYNGNKLIISSIIIVICAVMLLVPCTSAINKSDVYIDDETDDSPLQVYLMYWDIYQTQAIYEYNKQVRNGSINAREIELTIFEQDELEEMHERIYNETLTGEGPDIIFNDGVLPYYIDFQNMIEQNVFVDMDILINNSDTFKISDYNKQALNAGRIDNKRVSIPISYEVYYYITTIENLNKIGVNIPDTFTKDNLLEIANATHKNTEMPIGIWDAYIVNCIAPIMSDGITKDEEAVIRESLMILKEEFKREENIDYISGSLNTFMDNIFNGQIVMSSSFSYKSNTDWFSIYYDLYNLGVNNYNTDILLYNQPKNDNGDYSAFIDMEVMINANSKHKNDAFKFIEFMLSDRVQSEMIGDSGGIGSLPVNKNAYSIVKQRFIDGECYGHYPNNSLTNPMPQDEINNFINIIENVNDYKNHYEISAISNSTMQPINNYMVDDISFDEMVKQINENVK